MVSLNVSVTANAPTPIGQGSDNIKGFFLAFIGLTSSRLLAFIDIYFTDRVNKHGIYLLTDTSSIYHAISFQEAEAGGERKAQHSCSHDHDEFTESFHH